MEFAANALGMARAAFDAAQAYASDRIVANKRIGDYQAIAHKLADMSAQIEAAKWMGYYGAWRPGCRWQSHRGSSHMGSRSP